MASPQFLVVQLDASKCHVFQVNIAPADFGGFEGAHHHVLQEQVALSLQNNTTTEFRETFNRQFVESAGFDNELAFTVNAAFDTDNLANAVANVNVSVNGPATSRREIERFGAIINSVLNRLRVVRTRVRFSAVVAGNGNPVVGLLFRECRRFCNG